MDRVSLRKVIEGHFNTDEIKTLCFDLDIDYENLDGDSKPSKIRELISLCERQNRRDELIETVLRLRPAIRDNYSSSSTGSTPSFRSQVTDKEIVAIKDWLLPRFANLVSGEVNYLGGISSSFPAEFRSFSFIFESRKTHYDSIGVMIRRYDGPSPTQHMRLWELIQSIPNPKNVGLRRIVLIVLSEYDYHFNLENLDHYEPDIDIVLGYILPYPGGQFMLKKMISTG
jgi:hypothetical protein